MPAGIKVRVAEGRLLIWKGDGSGDYRRMDPTDKECKAAWTPEVAAEAENSFYLVQASEAPGVDGFVLVPSDEHVAGEVTVEACDDPDGDPEGDMGERRDIAEAQAGADAEPGLS